MRLLLIRHGQSTWNAEGRLQGWGDAPLDNRGREESQALAGRLRRQETIAALYTSPLLRARETAEIIAGEMGLSLTADDRLKERGAGPLTGLTGQEIANRFPDYHRKWYESMRRVEVPGQEIIEDFRARVCAVMADIIAAHTHETTVAIVSHGGVFGVYLSELIGLDVHLRLPFHFANASLSILSLDGSRYRILLLNDTCHLEGIEG